MTSPREDPTPPADPTRDPDQDEELAPAFDVDLDPEDQGTAEAASETSG